MRKQQRLALHRETLRRLEGTALGLAVGGNVVYEPSVSTTASVKVGCTGDCPQPTANETCGGGSGPTTGGPQIQQV